MINQSIELAGITPISHFPQCPPHHPCTQFCESDTLFLPSKKLKTEKICKIDFTVLIESFKIICTPVGKKLLINGKKLIKVIFVTNHCHSPLYPVHFEIPFCTFVLLKDNHDDIDAICTVVEDVSVQCISSHSLTIASTIFVCPAPPPSHPVCAHCHSCL